MLWFFPKTNGYFVLGLVRSRDGTRLGVASPAYGSLPSPNMPTADDQTQQIPVLETQVRMLFHYQPVATWDWIVCERRYLGQSRTDLAESTSQFLD